MTSLLRNLGFFLRLRASWLQVRPLLQNPHSDGVFRRKSLMSQVLMDPALRPRTFGAFLNPLLVSGELSRLAGCCRVASSHRPSMKAGASSASAGGPVLDPEGPDCLATNCTSEFWNLLKQGFTTDSEHSFCFCPSSFLLVTVSCKFLSLVRLPAFRPSGRIGLFS